MQSIPLSGLHTSWLSKPESESVSLVFAEDVGRENVVVSQLNGVDSDKHNFGDVTSAFCGTQRSIKYNK